MIGNIRIKVEFLVNLNKLIKNKKIVHDNTNNVFNRNNFFSHTRVFIKIQDGCNNFYSYCIVPYFRGKLGNIPVFGTIKNIKEKEAKKFKEIVLTGVNIGKYQNNQLDLVDSVKK